MPQMSPYQEPDYLKSLSNWGEPIWLEQAQGWICPRNIPQSTYTDMITPYPFGYFDDPEYIRSEALQKGAVSLVWVSDPLSTQYDLHCEVRMPFKTHFWVDFSKPHEPSSHHRYEIKNVLLDLEYQCLKSPTTWLTQWHGLYQNLVQRHQLRNGFYDYTLEQSRALLRLPQVVLFGAFYKGEAVLMHVWLMSREGETAYSHLVAPGPLSYEMKAAYGLYHYALGYFRQLGTKTCMLGSGRQNQDGLAKFKAGWANASASNTLYGMVLQPDLYKTLCRGGQNPFFPAYRHPND